MSKFRTALLLGAVSSLCIVTLNAMDNDDDSEGGKKDFYPWFLYTDLTKDEEEELNECLEGVSEDQQGKKVKNSSQDGEHKEKKETDESRQKETSDKRPQNQTTPTRNFNANSRYTDLVQLDNEIEKTRGRQHLAILKNDSVAAHGLKEKLVSLRKQKEELEKQTDEHDKNKEDQIKIRKKIKQEEEKRLEDDRNKFLDTQEKKEKQKKELELSPKSEIENIKCMLRKQLNELEKSTAKFSDKVKKSVHQLDKAKNELEEHNQNVQRDSNDNAVKAITAISSSKNKAKNTVGTRSTSTTDRINENFNPLIKQVKDVHTKTTDALKNCHEASKKTSNDIDKIKDQIESTLADLQKKLSTIEEQVEKATNVTLDEKNDETNQMNLKTLNENGTVIRKNLEEQYSRLDDSKTKLKDAVRQILSKIKEQTNNSIEIMKKAAADYKSIKERGEKISEDVKDRWEVLEKIEQERELTPTERKNMTEATERISLPSENDTLDFKSLITKFMNAKTKSEKKEAEKQIMDYLMRHPECIGKVINAARRLTNTPYEQWASSLPTNNKKKTVRLVSLCADRSYALLEIARKAAENVQNTMIKILDYSLAKYPHKNDASGENPTDTANNPSKSKTHEVGQEVNLDDPRNSAAADLLLNILENMNRSNPENTNNDNEPRGAIGDSKGSDTENQQTSSERTASQPSIMRETNESATNNRSASERGRGDRGRGGRGRGERGAARPPRGRK